MKKIFSIAILAVLAMMAVSCKNGNKKNTENVAAEEVAVADSTVVDAADTSVVFTPVADAVAE